MAFIGVKSTTMADQVIDYQLAPINKPIKHIIVILGKF